MSFFPHNVVLAVLKGQGRVSYEGGLKEADIVDKALFRLVLQTLTTAGHSREDFFGATEKLRLAVYRRLMGDDIFNSQGAVGLAYAQWHWMKAVCEHLQINWPSDATTEPRKYGTPPDLAYTSLYVEIRQKETRKREEDKKAKNAATVALSQKAADLSPGQQGPSKPAKIGLAILRSAPKTTAEAPHSNGIAGPAQASQFRKTVGRRIRALKSDQLPTPVPAPASEPGKLAALVRAPESGETLALVTTPTETGSSGTDNTVVERKEPAGTQPTREILDENAANIQANQSQAQPEPMGMPQIWKYLMKTPHVPEELVTPALSRDMYGPFDILFPASKNWAVCWDGYPQYKFKADLNEAVCVREYPLGQGYYKIQVSQVPGTRCTLGNAEAVFQCWQRLKEWSRLLFHGGQNIPVDDFFNQIHYDAAVARGSYQG